MTNKTLPKTAVVGASGFVGRHLLAAYQEHFPSAVGTSFSQKNERLITFDIRAPNLKQLGLSDQGYEAVAIAAAQPNPGACTNDPDGSHALNVIGMLKLIEQIHAEGLTSIFLSSDYVFSGEHGNYSDTHRPFPSTLYGTQKLVVETKIAEITDKYFVARLSKIFGREKGDGTLLDDIANQLSRGKQMRLADDQIFSPTYVGDLVNAILSVQRHALTGVINTASPESLSRFEIGRRIAAAMGVDKNLVQRISLHKVPGMEDRPLNTSLMPDRLLRETDATFTPLSESISHIADKWRS